MSYRLVVIKSLKSKRPIYSKLMDEVLASSINNIESQIKGRREVLYEDKVPALIAKDDLPKTLFMKGH